MDNKAGVYFENVEREELEDIIGGNAGNLAYDFAYWLGKNLRRISQKEIVGGSYQINSSGIVFGGGGRKM